MARDIVVTTPCGALRGTEAGGVCAFLGIPYAAPPAGPNRLQPPRPPDPWSGVRDATRYGAAPPQLAPPPSAGSDWDTDLAGDDCLNLNIWTPDPARTGLPVMVWIQGGAFEIGSTAAYDGRNFARDSVVCVVINWRVGADGFLYLGDGHANVGLLDQVAALEWVRENIAGFGGDPGNVTVFGESAGAMSIGALLSMPRAEGLFRRAILQSGAAHHVIAAPAAERIGRALAAELRVPQTREAMAAVPVTDFLAAQSRLKAELLARPDPEHWGHDVVASTMLWQPVIDGDVIPRRPIDRIAAGAGAAVDVLAGTNTEDWKLFLAITGVLSRVTEEGLSGTDSIEGFPPPAAYGLPVPAGLDAYRDRYPGAGPGDLLAAVQTDWWVRIPALRLADAHADAAHGTGAHTYMYEFAWPAPGLGAVHAVEVPFVFDTLDRDSRLFGRLLGDNPPQELADTMHAAWVQFAATGDPGWPAYEPARRATMRFGSDSPAVVDDPRAWERALWEGLR
ncbi:carboxylesterase/lipase family protein [Arthrobacter sp. PM3]|uniref:carboxylesterase/lipase family protein n=1 Tax=Arthrobacter sp. PM3 TaxID=2017685 RepID=UPI000E10D0A3|nr:carboxylesterase family protein [Arthrobacter sp. PM3]AXJ09202.1 carboxylesterase [Arthrobacter sp. PM3]